MIPTLISNAESQVQQGLNSTAVSLPDPWSKPLPGLAGPQRSGRLRHISFTPDGVDLSLAMPPASDPSAPPLATIKPTSFPASVRAAIGLSVIVRDDLLKVASSLTVAWTVRRKDTNEVIASATKAYLDPVGNGLIMQHHSAALYHVDEYDVRCSVRLTLGNQTGEIWSTQQTLKITDSLNRHHKFVQWGPHQVFFRNTGTGWAWWTRKRTSRVHRTAVAARCLMLRKASEAHDFFGSDGGFTTVTYSDTLPFPWSELDQHRGPSASTASSAVPTSTRRWPRRTGSDPGRLVAAFARGLGAPSGISSNTGWRSASATKRSTRVRPH